MKFKKQIFIKNEDMDPRLREDEETSKLCRAYPQKLLSEGWNDEGIMNFNISGFTKLFNNSCDAKTIVFNIHFPFILSFKKQFFSEQKSNNRYLKNAALINKFIHLFSTLKRQNFLSNDHKKIKQKLFQFFSILISSKTIATHLKSIKTIATDNHENDFTSYGSSQTSNSPSPHPRAGGDPCLQFFFSLCIIILLINHCTHGMLLDENVPAESLEHAKKILNKRKKSISSISSELIEFNFSQYPLKDLINDFAQKLNINVLYPETETVTATVSFNAGKKITMNEAWNFITMIIEQAGYTLVMRGTTS